MRQGAWMRLPRTHSERGLQHDRRAGLAAGAGPLRVPGERPVGSPVGREADLSNELEPPSRRGLGGAGYGAPGRKAACGRFAPSSATKFLGD
jgi:hypothetical protein